jgi:hypothetical protein
VERQSVQCGALMTENQARERVVSAERPRAPCAGLPLAAAATAAPSLSALPACLGARRRAGISLDRVLGRCYFAVSWESRLARSVVKVLDDEPRHQPRNVAPSMHAFAGGWNAARRGACRS